MKLLHVSSSIFRESGKSFEVANHFISEWQRKHPAAEVVVRDLSLNPIPHLDAETFEANIAPAGSRTPQQQVLAELADTAIDELMSADVLVLSVPMYNFGIPSTLKAWIDAVARAGTTFRYTAEGPEGLVGAKETYVFCARGGRYKGTANDTQTPYLKTYLNFLGIRDINFIFAEQLNMKTEQAPSILAEAKAEAENLLQN